MRAVEHERIVESDILSPYVVLMETLQQCIMLVRSLRQNQDEWVSASRSDRIDLNRLKLVADDCKILGFATNQIEDLERAIVSSESGHRENLTPSINTD